MTAKTISMENINPETMKINSGDRLCLKNETERSKEMLSHSGFQIKYKSMFVYDENLKVLIITADSNDWFSGEYLFSYRNPKKLKQLLFHCADTAEKVQIDNICDLLGMPKDDGVIPFEMTEGGVMKILDSNELSQTESSQLNSLFIMMEYYHALKKYIYWWDPVLKSGMTQK